MSHERFEIAFANGSREQNFSGEARSTSIEQKVQGKGPLGRLTDPKPLSYKYSIVRLRFCNVIPSSFL